MHNLVVQQTLCEIFVDVLLRLLNYFLLTIKIISMLIMY